MKLPKETKRYCPFCKKHTIQELKVVKKKKASELKQGQRRFRRVTKGYMGFPRPKPANEKQTKKLDIRYVCKECKKAHILHHTFRAKKFEVKK